MSSENQPYRIRGYGPGHPWYYILGGAVLSPKQIRAEVIRRGYRGCSVYDIDKADAKSEPQRSEQLRRIRAKAKEALRNDLSRYREVARELHQHRKQLQHGEHEPQCENVHTSMSLKHNHIYNDFAHIVTIDALLARQQDLFDL